MSEANRLAVLGAGAWGTALAIQAARAGNRVTLWARIAPNCSSRRDQNSCRRTPRR